MNSKCYPKPAVSAIIANQDSVLLVKRGSEPNRGLWSFPGGVIEPGETARDALARELFEETSLNVAVGDLFDIRDVIVSSGDTLKYHYVIIIFLAEVVSGELAPGSDAADARWVSFDEVPSLATTPGLVERLTRFRELFAHQ